MSELTSRCVARMLPIALLGALCGALAGVIASGCAPQASGPNDGGDNGDGGPSDTIPADALSATGRLCGFLYRAEPDGTVSVSALPPQGATDEPVANATLGADTGSLAFSDDRGAFSFPALPEGSHTVRVDADGALDTPVELAFQATIEAGATSSGRLSPADATAAVGAAMGWAYLDPQARLVLSPSARSDMQPLAGATLMFDATAVPTDARGAYLATDMQPGTYQVSVQAAAPAQAFGSGIAVTILGGLTSAGADDYPSEWGAAHGHVGVAFNAPAPYLTVAPSARSLEVTPSAVATLETGQAVLADDRGGYTFYGLTPGLHTLSVTARGVGGAVRAIIVMPGTVTGGSDAPAGSVSSVELTLAPGSRTPAVDRTVQLQALAIGPDGTAWAGFSTFYWSISDTRMATVDLAGRLTGISVGSVTARARAVNQQDSLDLVVMPRGYGEATSLQLVALGPTTISTGATRQLEARVRDAGGGLLPGYPVTYQSSNSTAAAVTARGTVAGLREGQALITATPADAPTVQGQVSVTIVQADQRLRVTPPELSFDADGAETLQVEDRAAGADGPMHWTATAHESWLTVNPDIGTGNGEITVTVTRGDLTPGIYTDLVDVSAGQAGRQFVLVTLNVQDAIIIIE